MTPPRKPSSRIVRFFLCWVRFPFALWRFNRMEGESVFYALSVFLGCFIGFPILFFTDCDSLEEIEGDIDYIKRL